MRGFGVNLRRYSVEEYGRSIGTRIYLFFLAAINHPYFGAEQINKRSILALVPRVRWIGHPVEGGKFISNIGSVAQLDTASRLKAGRS